MKLGFALKKSKKKPLLGAATGDAAGGAFEGVAPTSSAPEKVFVTDFDPSAAAALAPDGTKALVIPLIAANEWRGADVDEAVSAQSLPPAVDGRSEPQGACAGSGSPPKGGGGKEVSADEEAVRTLLAEARGENSAASSASASSKELVIPLNGAGAGVEASNEAPVGDEEAARAAKKAELFQDAAQRQRKAGEKPILQQNAVPGLDKLADVKDKYQRDLSLRPDALDVHSEAYAAVPIEEFGAAMLRGMGWKGPTNEDDNADAAAPKPRHKLLGLGATMRPPLAGDKGKRKKKRHQSKLAKEQSPPPQQSPSSQRRAGMNLPDEEKDSRRRSDSRERRTREDGRSRSDRGSHKRRRRDGDDGEDGRRSTARRSRSRSDERRDGHDRRERDRKSDRRHDRHEDDRKSGDRRRRERSRSDDRDRERHRSSRR